jgi:hypothetical protein
LLSDRRRTNKVHNGKANPKSSPSDVTISRPESARPEINSNNKIFTLLKDGGMVISSTNYGTEIDVIIFNNSLSRDYESD